MSVLCALETGRDRDRDERSSNFNSFFFTHTPPDPTPPDPSINDNVNGQPIGPCLAATAWRVFTLQSAEAGPSSLPLM